MKTEEEQQPEEVVQEEEEAESRPATVEHPVKV